MNQPANQFEWFAAWVNEHLVLTLTFARPTTTDQMFRTFGADAGLAELLTAEQAAQVETPLPGAGAGRPLSARSLELLRRSGASPDRVRALAAARDRSPRPVHKVRVGACGPWTYAVEALTVLGARPEFLEALSRDGGEAFSLCYTPGMSLILYARDGTLRAGLDLMVPHIRFGLDRQHFDSVMSTAGLVADRPLTPAAGAYLVELAFGITIDREMLERLLPGAPLPT